SEQAALLRNFLNGVPTPDVGISFRAIEAKAAVVLERVAVFTRKCSANTSPQSMQPLVQEFTSLSAMLDNLMGLLPSSDPQALGRIQNVEKARRLGIVYSVLCAATIRLHASLALRGRGGACLNPIIGISAQYTIWIEAAQVVFDEVASIRSMHASGTLPTGSPDDRAMTSLVQQAITAMSAFTVNVPLTNFQVGKIQETAQAI
ncbi:hypothetical protein GALMADRAFT_259315, partial [Galerina marginata CBS 339.88]